MTNTQPWRQHNFIGSFTTDALATADIVARVWDLAGSPQAGMMYYDSTLKVMKMWNGTAWVIIGAYTYQGLGLGSATLLPAGSVTSGLSYNAFTNRITGGSYRDTQGNLDLTAAPVTADMFNAAGDILTLTLNADGSASLAVSGGVDTYNTIIDLKWW